MFVDIKRVNIVMTCKPSVLRRPQDGTTCQPSVLRRPQDGTTCQPSRVGAVSHLLPQKVQMLR